MSTRSTRAVVPIRSMGADGMKAPRAGQPAFSAKGEIALSGYWRKNTSNVEATELANLLRALRKVAGHLGQNAATVEYLGMSQGCAGIVLDPAMVTGRYPIPPAKVDFMVGLTVHEVLHGIVWSDHVWKLLEPVFRRMGPRETVAFQKLVRTGEDIYVDCFADRSILGLYVEKARNVVLKEIGEKFQGKEPSVDELIHIWWETACGGNLDDSQGTAYQQPLRELHQLTNSVGEVARLGTGIADRCERRAALYSKAWQSLSQDVSRFRLIEKQLYWYPSPEE
ncbi:MAG: hypothetical protein FJY85_14500, partial [Deltaproteobacteria bacterium]|nr:hypothetical protein [Deltaproteobacteria bacterium]